MQEFRLEDSGREPVRYLHAAYMSRADFPFLITSGPLPAYVVELLRLQAIPLILGVIISIYSQVGDSVYVLTKLAIIGCQY